MEALVKSCNVYWLWSGICPTSSKITNCEYLWERLSYFVYLLYVVTHPGKLHCYHVVLVGYCLACPKFSEITNH